jgi:hypothetical protein
LKFSGNTAFRRKGLAGLEMILSGAQIYENGDDVARQIYERGKSLKTFKTHVYDA